MQMLVVQSLFVDYTLVVWRYYKNYFEQKFLSTYDIRTSIITRELNANKNYYFRKKLEQKLIFFSELNQSAAERGRRSLGGHLCFM